MDDLISREAAVDEVEQWAEHGYDVIHWTGIKAMLEVQPAVDAVPVVHARWIDYKDDHQCSACKEHTIIDYYVWKAIQFEFCPYCGAKMDGERREDHAERDADE